MTTEQIDCPICFDPIGEKNNITTECGHKFHASCLMTNISRNGFGCPCCRTVMVENDNDQNDNDQNDNDDDNQMEMDEMELEMDEMDETFADDALRGLRLLTNLLEGNEHDQEDVVAEYQYVQQCEEEENRPPTLDLVSILLAQQGITFENLVANALMDHDEYEDNMELLDRSTDDLWGKLRIIISNFKNNIDREREDMRQMC